MQKRVYERIIIFFINKIYKYLNINLDICALARLPLVAQMGTSWAMIGDDHRPTVAVLLYPFTASAAAAVLRNRTVVLHSVHPKGGLRGNLCKGIEMWVS